MSRPRSHPFVLLCLGLTVVVGVLVWLKARSGAQAGGGTVNAACYGDIDRAPYAGGFQASQFGTMTAARINAGGPPSGGLQLDTNLTPLDSQRIVLPFDQRVRVKYVYRNAGASHSLGWFYLDQIQHFFDRPVTDPNAQLVDADGDGIADWFQWRRTSVGRQYNGLWEKASGVSVPKLFDSNTDYSDGGIYPHIPNVLESVMSTGGGLIFKHMDDDGGTSLGGRWPGGPPDVPAADSSGSNDGIPDYDVNGDGTVGNEADRTVDLGIIQGGREIVFFAMFYYGFDLKGVNIGIAGDTANYRGEAVPWFTKNTLNPDFGARTPGTLVRKTAIGCARDDSTCYTARGATLGWMDQNAINRLNTATYNYLQLDDTVVEARADANGNVPHFIVAAPRSDPDRWLIAFDDQPQYAGASDYDYNDCVFVVEKNNGGQVVSNLVSHDIPANKLSEVVISKVRIRFDATFPSPGCNGLTEARIRIYYSIDGKQTWREVSFPSKTSGDVTIDVLGAGDVGNQLYWRADFASPSDLCQPVLNDLKIGYEAIEHGEFKYASPVPLGNVAYTGTLETPPFPAGQPAPTANDYSLRGHFRATRLYDPNNKTQTDLTTLWDAGAVLAAQNPDTRAVYTADAAGTAALAFTAANIGSLSSRLLTTADRAELYSGQRVYDFNGDGASDDIDATFVLQWTRGWEYPSGITFNPAQSTLARAWKLGPVHYSSPAIVGPPPRPVWIDGRGAPGNYVSKHNTFRQARTTRDTLALVGAQDGMIHAFSAGRFRYGADPQCTTTAVRGCFAGATDTERYGTGAEAWAYIPPSQLSQLKHNHPRTRGFITAANRQAEVDGSLAVEDVFDAARQDFRTVVYATLGRLQPYVTAVDITDSAPAPMWTSDFSDPDFNGSDLSPSVGLTARGGGRFLTIFSSGLAAIGKDLYLYFLDAATGALSPGSGDTGKVKMNTGANTAQALGFAGYPNLVDADLDGLIDRVYAVDTSGRIFKYDITTGAHCAVAAIGESAFSGMAALVAGNDQQPKVRLFLGGGPNPDGSGTPATNYHLFAFEDDDPLGTCAEGGAALVYRVTLPQGQKLWAAPFVAGDRAYYATASTTSLSLCLAGDGALYALATTGDGQGAPLGGVPSPTALTGSPVSSIRIYDQHALINTVGGGTKVIGNGTWDNAPAGTTPGGTTTVSALTTLFWQEL
jgi:type IV pilus assembly protein PilY1